MRQKTTTARERRRLQLKKESLRSLTLRELTADDLQDVVGGYCKSCKAECTATMV